MILLWLEWFVEKMTFFPEIIINGVKSLIITTLIIVLGTEKIRAFCPLDLFTKAICQRNWHRFIIRILEKQKNWSIAWEFGNFLIMIQEKLKYFIWKCVKICVKMDQFFSFFPKFKPFWCHFTKRFWKVDFEISKNSLEDTFFWKFLPTAAALSLPCTKFLPSAPAQNFCPISPLRN